MRQSLAGGIMAFVIALFFLILKARSFLNFFEGVFLFGIPALVSGIAVSMLGRYLLKLMPAIGAFSIAGIVVGIVLGGFILFQLSMEVSLSFDGVIRVLATFAGLGLAYGVSVRMLLRVMEHKWGRAARWLNN